MFRWLIEWFLRWWRKPPGQAINLEYDMANRRLTWGWPEVGPRQAPLAHALIDLRVDPSLPWDNQDVVEYQDGALTGELLLIDVNPGTFYYRCTIVDDRGTPDALPAVIEVSGAYDAPGSAVNFTATDE